MQSTQLPRAAVMVLRVAVVLALLGCAWAHLRWSPPYRALLWNESLLGQPFEAITGRTWDSYVTDPRLDPAITRGTKLVGVGYLILALAALFASKERQWPRRLLYVASGGLLLLAGLSWMDHNYRIGTLIESTSRWFAPALLAIVVAGRGRLDGRVERAARVAVALTFFGHAMYALGWHATPGDWITMVMSIFGFTEPTAIRFVRAAGLLDMAVVVAMFVPTGMRVGLLWAALWGALTAFARLWNDLSLDFLRASLEQNGHEFLVRLPQAAVPLMLFLALNERRRTEV